ncbi:NAD(P)-dependent dehydrogenase (short-subunit alcohol dehydrogenase family) [Streptomyces achromogenes]|nr:NAD(P)-dependent dehydrogenase (short-subunit alcohol dehydrogenase family) [Streptomyces achromogenes]
MGNFLAGRSIAVTGAGRGIGRAVALAAAAEGARVVVNDYGVAVDGAAPTSEVAEAVVKEIEAAGGEAVAVADDISTMAGGRRLVDVAVESYGRLDGVVCVAGILRERMLFNMSEEEWDPVVATHLKGTFTVFRAASAVMREQRGGTLIGFTSGNHQGSVSQANYSAAKGGIISLVRSAALGLHKYGVTANAVAPVARTRMSGRGADGAVGDRRTGGRGRVRGLSAVGPGAGRRDHRAGVHRRRAEDRGVGAAEGTPFGLRGGWFLDAGTDRGSPAGLGGDRPDADAGAARGDGAGRSRGGAAQRVSWCAYARARASWLGARFPAPLMSVSSPPT